ncbi:MAG TPA: hypothetical protein VLM85_08760, partial [Polyangiaceae bacterium]|nr:hypothetical protein [Polyangiaceae bacterium]
ANTTTRRARGRGAREEAARRGHQGRARHVLAGYAGHPARVRLEIDLPELEVLGKVLHPRG